MSRWPSWEQKQVTFGLLDYEPHVAQRPIHRSTARVLVVSGGERAGKSRLAAMEVVARVPWADRVALVGQKYDQTHKEFSYTNEALTRLGAINSDSMPRHGQWQMEAETGCVLETISLERGINQLTGTGEAYDIVVFCEWGFMPYNAFLAARGRVSETRGLIMAVGTLQDDVGWQANLWTMGQGPNKFGAVSFSLPSWANRVLFPEGEDDPEIIQWRGALSSKGEIARRINGTVEPSPARMFPQFSEPIHVQPWASYDPQADVYLAVDAGYYPSRYAILACQFRTDEHGREILVVVDEIWEHNLFHEDAIDMAKDRPWADNVVQAIGGHETKAHQAAKSTAEVWEEQWPGLYFETFDAGLILEGATRMRWLMRDEEPGPRLFLSPRCTGTAREFGHYKRKVDRQGNVTSEQPQDKNNDAMDALRNLVVWRYGVVEPNEEVDTRVVTHTQFSNPFG